MAQHIVGSFVLCTQGYGEVVESDEKTGLYKVQLHSWTLSEGQPVFVSTLGENLRAIVGLEVSTAYGKGTVQSIDQSNAVYRVELSSWTLSEGQKVYVHATGHNFKIDASQAALKSVPVGTVVTTSAGKGVVKAYREDEGIYAVELTTWELSEGQKVYVYTQLAGLSQLPVPVSVGGSTSSSSSAPGPHDAPEKTQICSPCTIM